MAACALSIPATALTKASYRRLDVDEPENSSPISFLRVDDSQVSILQTYLISTISFTNSNPDHLALTCKQRVSCDLIFKAICRHVCDNFEKCEKTIQLFSTTAIIIWFAKLIFQPYSILENTYDVVTPGTSPSTHQRKNYVTSEDRNHNETHPIVWNVTSQTNIYLLVHIRIWILKQLDCFPQTYWIMGLSMFYSLSGYSTIMQPCFLTNKQISNNVFREKQDNNFKHRRF